MERRREREKQLRILRYASPPPMVAAVTARRLAGDWRGACAAALVDAHIDLRDVASRYGADEAARIESELRGFAPDLLRRFLPRTSSLALVPTARVVLSRLAEPVRTRPGPRRRGTPLLVATLPATDRRPQRVALRVTDSLDLPNAWYDLPDWCWHADAVAARRWAYGASDDRLAWHTADGRPHRQGESTPTGSPADRAGEVETVAALLAAGRTIAAYEAVGWTVDAAGGAHWYTGWPTVEQVLGWHVAALPVLAAEARRLARRYGATTLHLANSPLAVDVADGGALTVRAAAPGSPRGGPNVFGTPAPMDVALLRRGMLTPDELHPLVHEALFPGRTQAWRVPQPAPPPPFRVRCGPDWHLVRVADNRIETPHHTDEELRREFLLAGLGGPIGGCAAAVRAWRTGMKPVPKEIRKIRRDLFGRAFHGDTEGLLSLIFDGMDPGLRDGVGGTLMHRLAFVDHTQMLPILTAAGLCVDEPDRDGNTPLHAAAAAAATEVMAALVDAGADPDAVNREGRTAAEVLAAARRTGG
ncbi:ankyrin repeat domain-containing protein [Micromonospora sp. NPDC047670]|uniref:ankyrin repeat domain-containing protein n=1 Tax=Micromonospora sp. NPDC047670 TaxID=3364252 RepID=UPI003722CB0A